MEKNDQQDTRLRTLSFKDLIDINEWQKIQDNFSVVTDVGLRTVSPKGLPLTTPSGWPKLCSNVLKDSLVADKICGWCLPTFLGGKGIVDRNLSFVCHAGLYNFVLPLRGDNGNVLSYFIIGPIVLVMRKPKEEYRKAAEQLELDLDDFWNAILEIKVMSFHGIQALVELIKDIGEYTIKLAYQNLTKRKEMVMEAPGSLRLNRLLNTLLDVAFQVTGADIGSIMFFEKSNDELTIQASRGIPEEIVRNTKVRLGDGISGIAAKESRSFLIDDNLEDNRIKSYLNRPYINSSMVLPINVENRVMGVMNLGALKTSEVRFNIGNLRLMDKLINLATLAFPSSK